MCRAPMPRPNGSLRSVSAGSTARQFMSGSPIPMKTTFVIASGGSSSRISRTCPAISNDVEVALKSHRAGRAEGALQRASGLRRDAERQPIVLGNGDGLDRLAVAQHEEELLRPVASTCCRAAIDSRGRSNAERELLAERLRQLRHRLEVGRGIEPESADDLLGPIVGNALARRKRPQALLRLAQA